jgi:hypothetical protein
MKAEISLNFGRHLRLRPACRSPCLIVLTKTAANFVAHSFAKLRPARRPILFADIMAIEHVEIPESDGDRWPWSECDNGRG